MQKIAVISDTHWSTWNTEEPLVEKLTERIQDGYDAIWHAGDVVGAEVLQALEKFAPVVCVKGNCDRFMDRLMPHSFTSTVEGVKVGMIHGWDLPLDHTPSIIDRFADDVRIIIHGHTHRRRNQECTRANGDKVRIINPGSVSSPRGGETPGFGELVVDGEQWEYREFGLMG